MAGVLELGLNVDTSADKIKLLGVLQVGLAVFLSDAGAAVALLAVIGVTLANREILSIFFVSVVRGRWELFCSVHGACVSGAGGVVFPEFCAPASPVAAPECAICDGRRDLAGGAAPRLPGLDPEHCPDLRQVSGSILFMGLAERDCWWVLGLGAGCQVMVGRYE